MSKLYVCTHSIPDSPQGRAIDLGTQACVPSGWVIDPRHPSTHAFVVVEDKEGLWRLDGQPPRATYNAMEQWPTFTPTPYSVPPNQAGGVWKGTPTAAWEILAEDVPGARRGGIDIEAGIRKARELTGTEYDWGEILAQGTAAFSILPFAHRLQILGRADAFKRAAICTKVAMLVLRACGGAADDMVALMPDLYPERLGQRLRAAEGVWTRRLPLRS